jgi:hypothetical protein
VWLLNLAAGFASNLYVSDYIVSWITVVALLIVTPVLFLSHKVVLGLAGFALGMGAMLLWHVTSPPVGCESQISCSILVERMTYAGAFLAVIGLSMLPWLAFRARESDRS